MRRSGLRARTLSSSAAQALFVVSWVSLVRTAASGAPTGAQGL